MSLVNDMLKDLDRRQAPDNRRPMGVSGYGDLTGETRGTARPWVIGLGVGVLALAMIAGGLSYQLWLRGQEVTEVPGTSEATLPSNQQMVTPDESVSEPEAPEVVPIEAAVSETIVDEKVPTPQPETVAPPSIEVVEPAEPPRVSVEQPVSMAVPMAQPRVKPVPAVAKEDLENDFTEPPLPNAPEKPVPVARMSKQTAQTPEQRDADQAERALKLYQEGQVAGALSVLKEFVSAQSVHQRSRYLLAHLLFKEGQVVEADALISDSDMDQVSMRELKARAALAQGKKGEALSILLKRLPSVQEYPDYHALLAVLYQQAGQHAQAVERYTLLLNQNAQEVKWWMGLGISLESLGQNEAAIMAYNKALQDQQLTDSLRLYAQSRLNKLAMP